jgi:hypothetical protein
MKFYMAGSDYAADCQHVQRDSFLFLVRFAELYVLDEGREHVQGGFLC